MIDTVIEQARTGEIGDGKIFGMGYLQALDLHSTFSICPNIVGMWGLLHFLLLLSIPTHVLDA